MGPPDLFSQGGEAAFSGATCRATHVPAGCAQSAAPPYGSERSSAAILSRISEMSLSVAISGGAVTIVSVARRT